ncbi:MAG: hypothetical protein EOP45_04895, partial [Sphingobacteriaceae bacterium]
MMPTLDNFIKSEAMSSLMRLKPQTKINTISGHGSILKDLFEHCSILEHDLDRIKHHTIIDRNFSILTPSREDWENNNDLIPEDTELWFTDGAVNGGKAGFGIYNQNRQLEFMGYGGSFCNIL